MPERIQAPYAGLLAQPHGLIIVCGPTGSGKTTTLYASLQGLDAARRNIMTIEDPIEYRLPNIGQIQVRSKIGLNFAGGLKHILRQDPDIILVGETRDLETAEIALRASLTGHLVFTTLHTNDAPGSVMRLVDIGVDPHLLASCLRGVLAQRLVRTLCLECRRPAVLSEAVAARLGGQAPDHVGANLFAPVGCDACLEGYHGRQGVFELLLMSEGLRESVREGGASEARLAALAAEAGMRSLREDAFSRLLLGTTSVEEVLNLA